LSSHTGFHGLFGDYFSTFLSTTLLGIEHINPHHNRGLNSVDKTHCWTSAFSQ
jgi:hypothetical protein